MEFEWDDNKEKINIQKHGIDFSTASQVFFDDDRLDIYDTKHSSYEEDRYLTIGIVKNICLILTVVNTERDENIRIISARKANKTEKEQYYANQKNNH